MSLDRKISTFEISLPKIQISKIQTSDSKIMTTLISTTFPENEAIPTLISAASRGDETRVRTELMFGTKATVTDSRGFSALFYAASAGHVNIVQLLLDNGADEYIDGSLLSVTALTKGVRFPEIIKLLLEKDKRPLLTRKETITSAASLAIAYGIDESLELLLATGVVDFSRFSYNYGSKHSIRHLLLSQMTFEYKRNDIGYLLTQTLSKKEHLSLEDRILIDDIHLLCKEIDVNSDKKDDYKNFLNKAIKCINGSRVSHTIKSQCLFELKNHFGEKDYNDSFCKFPPKEPDLELLLSGERPSP